MEHFIYLIALVLSSFGMGGIIWYFNGGFQESKEKYHRNRVFLEEIKRKAESAQRAKELKMEYAVDQVPKLQGLTKDLEYNLNNLKRRVADIEEYLRDIEKSKRNDGAQ